MKIGWMPLVLILAALTGCSGLTIVADRYYVVDAFEAQQVARKAEAIVDLRPPDEFEAGHVPGAISIPLNQLWFRMYELPSELDAVVLAYDDVLSRQARAGEMLKREGYYRVYFVRGGFSSWLAAGGASSTAPAPSPVYRRDSAIW